jgi:saccharopine dehydrogenase-like NADP-dependent oxidoreductase
MRVGVLGVGAVGSRVIQRLAVEQSVDVTAVGNKKRLGGEYPQNVNVVSQLPLESIDVAILTMAAPHKGIAERCIAAGVSVLSVSDDRDDVRHLWALHDAAKVKNVYVVPGVGFAPGIACLLARHGAETLDVVEEIHVAKHGTAGPSCARQHHAALGAEASIWREGDWQVRSGGSGRELCWFPEPIGAHDCYNARLPDAFLLHHGFPGIGRISARMTATRRDRLTSRLPMLAPPHREGARGAIRVEVRGYRGEKRVSEVFGIAEFASVAASALIAAAVLHIKSPHFSGAITLSQKDIPAQVLLRQLQNSGLSIKKLRS